LYLGKFPYEYYHIQAAETPDFVRYHQKALVKAMVMISPGGFEVVDVHCKEQMLGRAQLTEKHSEEAGNVLLQQQAFRMNTTCHLYSCRQYAWD
jgi:hypothetical protein